MGLHGNAHIHRSFNVYVLCFFLCVENNARFFLEVSYVLCRFSGPREELVDRLKGYMIQVNYVIYICDILLKRFIHAPVSQANVYLL